MNKQKKNQIKILLKKFGHSLRRINNHLFYSFKLFYRSKFTIFIFVIFPILLLLLFGSIFAKQGFVNYELSVQNNDDSPYSNELIRLLENESITIDSINETVNPIEYMQQNNKVICLLIPVDWYENSLIYSESNVTLIVDPYSQRAQRIEHIVKKVLNEFNNQQNNTDPLINIELVGFYSREINYIDFFMPGIIGVIIMITGVLGTIIRQVHFKKIGILRKFATTPLTRIEYLSAELIWQFIIASVSTILIVFTSWVIFGFSWNSFNIILLPIIIVGVMLFTGIGLIISRLIKDNALLFGTLITIPMVFLSGVYFDVYGVRYMYIISRFSPLTYIVDALRSSMLTSSYSNAGINIGISLAIGIVALIIGIILTHWEKD
ncbi:MAG: ABC transporter permease [Asgard group archaeon]|nr:ABC transporter permease [Asgard group archaeon]